MAGTALLHVSIHHDKAQQSFTFRFSDKAGFSVFFREVAFKSRIFK